MRTYLPFKIIRSPGKASRAIANRWDVVVAKIPPCKDSDGQHHAKEFAKFMVVACNLHDDMLAALEVALGDVLYLAEKHGEIARFQDTLDQCSAVIARAHSSRESDNA